MSTPEAGPLRVLIADDDPMVRDILTSIVGTMPGISVVAVAVDGLEAVRAAREHDPDVIVMDLSMPRMDGIDATRAIRAADPAARILALTAMDEEARAQEILDAGATSYLGKAVRRDLLEAAIRSTAQGLGVVATGTARQHVGRSRPPATDLPRLTESERDVLRLLVAGHSNEEIAQQVFASLATVKKRVASLQTKLRVQGRVALAVQAATSGLLDRDQHGPSAPRR